MNNSQRSRYLSLQSKITAMVEGSQCEEDDRDTFLTPLIELQNLPSAKIEAELALAAGLIARAEQSVINRANQYRERRVRHTSTKASGKVKTRETITIKVDPTCDEAVQKANDRAAQFHQRKQARKGNR